MFPLLLQFLAELHVTSNAPDGSKCSSVGLFKDHTGFPFIKKTLKQQKTVFDLLVKAISYPLTERVPPIQIPSSRVSGHRLSPLSSSYSA